MTLFLSGFGLGVIVTLWTLHRIGRNVQRKAAEHAAQEQTLQLINEAWRTYAVKN